MSARPSIAEKRREFRRLHESGCFVIPNPWDVGSAVYLQSLGFKALATTSSGFAWTHGRSDNHITLELALTHFRALVEATDVPVNADFENGFAHDAAAVGRHVELAMHCGLAGLSIEDSSGDAARPLYELDHAVERMRAARAAIDRAGGDAMLIGRAECFLHGQTDVEVTIARLKAYANAGADCLYAPGLRTREQIRAVVAALAPKPVNLLIGWTTDLTVSDIAALGVRRISVGGSLARTAWGAFMSAATLLAAEGKFDGLAQAAGGRDLDSLFGSR